jgi:hypothetical protein
MLLRALVLSALVALALAAPASAPSSTSPTPGQIRQALSTARHSKNLWATVNVCGPHRAPHTLGIRAQMPALGFAAQLWVRIQVDYWNVAKQRFVRVADPHARGLVSLGTVTAGLQQGGESFAFTHGAYLRATVTFSYRRHGKLLLQLTRHTSAGHPGADQGIPPHHSAATCRLH